MENNPSLRKWAELQGLAVVAIDTGKKIGTLDDFYFDSSASPTMSQVPAFRVKTGLLSARALSIAAINTIGADAVTTANEQALREEKDDAILPTLALGRNLLSYKVMSTSGTLVGTIGNVLLDTTTPSSALHIAVFELSRSLREHLGGHHTTFRADQIAHYGQDVLVIPDEVANSL